MQIYAKKFTEKFLQSKLIMMTGSNFIYHSMPLKCFKWCATTLTAFSPVTGLSYIIAVLLQELIVFSYRIQVYCVSMVYSNDSAT